jgi:uncharacterized phage-associated protein
MKLQKLVYLAHGWWLAYHAEPIVDQRPEVWRYGPVFPNLYRALSGFGGRPIRQPQRQSPFESPPDVDENDDDAHNLLNWIWARYGGFTGVQLSDLTHEPRSPWRTVAQQHNFRISKNFAIPDDLIRQWFRTTEAQRQGVSGITA